MISLIVDKFKLKNYIKLKIKKESHRSDLGRGDFNRCKRVYIMNLDGQLLKGRRTRKARLDNPRLGRPMFSPLILATTWKIFQINCLGQTFSLIPNRRTRLRLHLIHYPLPFIFFYGCHS